MFNNLYYSSVSYVENCKNHPATQERLASDLIEFIEKRYKKDNQCDIAILETEPDDENCGNTLKIMDDYRDKHPGRLIDCRIIKDTGSIFNDNKIDLIVVPSCPSRYPEIIQNLSSHQTLKQKDVFLLFLPDFRAETDAYTNIKCPGQPVVFCDVTYDGHLSRVFMELFGVFNYDYRQSTSNNDNIFSNLKKFNLINGSFTYSQYQKVLAENPDVRFIYYFRDLRDMFICKFHTERTDSFELLKMEETHGFTNVIKRLYDGYKISDGKYFNSAKFEAEERKKWLADQYCYKVKHEELNNANIVNNILKIADYTGVYYSEKTISAAVNKSNDIMSADSFDLQKGIWLKAFDEELVEMFDEIVF